MIKRTAASDDRRPRRAARTPVRERSMARQAALLDAAEALLAGHDPEDVGIYQIAEQASVPPASVYHFFPTKDAAFCAVVERCIEGFDLIAAQPAPASELGNWPDYFRFRFERAQRYYNAHPAVLKLLYGGYGGHTVRQADRRANLSSFEGVFADLDALFVMPAVDAPARRFQLAFAAMDAVWSLSWAEHGQITDAAFAEALAVHQACCRLGLPERVNPSETTKSAAQAGRLIQLERAALPAGNVSAPKARDA